MELSVAQVVALALAVVLAAVVQRQWCNLEADMVAARAERLILVDHFTAEMASSFFPTRPVTLPPCS
jgi:hypothetical protein